MPSTCCVPHCNSNYATSKDGNIPVFAFPMDSKRLQDWKRRISREHSFQVTRTTRICIKHFDPRFINKNEKRPTLKHPIAYPSIFPNQPKYRTAQLPAERTRPDVRAKIIKENEKKQIEEDIERDRIHNINDLNLKSSKKLGKMLGDNLGDWLFFSQQNSALFLLHEDGEHPRVAASIRVSHDLTVKIFQGSMEISSRNIAKFLGVSQRCDAWSKLKNLLQHMKNYKLEELSYKEKLEQLLTLVGKVSESLNEENENLTEEKKEDVQLKLKFIGQQIQNTLRQCPRYEPEAMLFACRFYFNFPAAYQMVRDFNQYYLPHPTHIKRISSSFSSSLDLDSNHKAYLEEKSKFLTAEDKEIVLILDEIYVKEGMTYKGGSVVGVASNTTGDDVTLARTVQVFMIKSVYTKYSEVVAMYPVKNITGENLRDMAIQVLRALRDCGYDVITLIADNNKVNQSLYRLLGGGGKIKSWIKNPVDINKYLGLMFDTVHILKNIRNNWINQLLTNQTFCVPVLREILHVRVLETIASSGINKPYNLASLQHLKALYERERGKLAKVGYKLSRKGLFPSDIEKQQVRPVHDLFSEENAHALTEVEHSLGFDDVTGTQHFLLVINHWWRIVNVKNKFKGKHKRDPLQEPISNADCPQLDFLRAFCTWLKEWDDMDLPPEMQSNQRLPPRTGKLTLDTHEALDITTKTLIRISEHLLELFPNRVILLGILQGDFIEKRFGKYRTMNGRNYNVSYSTLLESEKKIRLLSLLKLKSTQENFNFQSFVKSIEDKIDSTPIDDDLYNKFRPCLDVCDSVTMTAETHSALVYIGGYAAKVALKYIKCPACQSLLVHPKEQLDFSSSPPTFRYLLNLDRGGLKKPKEFVLNITVTVYKIMMVLVSEPFEKKFLKAKVKQKSLAAQLINDKFEETLLEGVNICDCSLNTLSLAKFCISPLVNIFLNNYTKKINDTVVIRNERKLDTLRQ